MIVKGIDTVEFGIDIENYLIFFKDNLLWFGELKAKAQETAIEEEVTISDLTLKVHRTGIPFYAYKLSCNDFSICFMDKEMKENAPVRVRLMSSYLWSYGYSEATARLVKWFTEAFHLSISGTRLSRLDICMDTDEATFVECDIKGIVTKARGKKKHFVSDEFQEGRKFSGFTIGRGNPILARIYNKTMEIKKSQKTWFYQIWEEADWNENKDVWRVEFQIRREALKEFGIDNLDDVIEKEASLWAYLTGEWLLLKQPSRDNVSRWALKRKWGIVQKSSYNQVASPLTREKVKMGDTFRLMNQGAGILLSIAALNDHENLEETALALKACAEFKLERDQTNFSDEKGKRRKRFLTNNGS